MIAQASGTYREREITAKKFNPNYSVPEYSDREGAAGDVLDLSGFVDEGDDDPAGEYIFMTMNDDEGKNFAEIAQFAREGFAKQALT